MIQTSPGVLILVLKSKLNLWYWWKRANWVVTSEPETTADRSQLSPISSHAQIIIINRLPNKNCLSSFLKIHFEDGRLSVCTSADTHTHTHTHTHTCTEQKHICCVSVCSVLKPPEFPRHSLNYESLSEHIYIFAGRRFTDASVRATKIPPT